MEHKSSISGIIKDVKMRNVITQWWEGLAQNKGGRAQLRRCREPRQVFLHSMFFELSSALPQWPEKHGLSLATIAGLAANVDQSIKGVTFPQQLGTPKEPGASPPMSENRFRQLIKSRDWDEFYMRTRRAIIMLKRNINIPSLADFIWLFGVTQIDGQIEPIKSFQFQMAEHYFKSVTQNVKPSK